ncbi:hypothetical protein BDZ45DRAFT_290894 [Acephala macrosclerotiorum]|nr:hypothetical protein BDZ45DRAFT_290894 [Acephala macrosclerotiorum]
MLHQEPKQTFSAFHSFPIATAGCSSVTFSQSNERTIRTSNLTALNPSCDILVVSSCSNLPRYHVSATIGKVHISDLELPGLSQCHNTRALGATHQSGGAVCLEDRDDPTTRHCIAQLRRWNYLGRWMEACEGFSVVFPVYCGRDSIHRTRSALTAVTRESQHVP